MNNPLRMLWFRHYWWITFVTAVLIGSLVFAWIPAEHTWQSLAALIAAALSVVFFVQKQKLEELKVFERLFRKFNERYEQDFHSQLKNNPDEKTLSSYFNLCAEEFLFFREGLIHPLAWRAWCIGMQEFLKNDQISRHFDNDVKPCSRSHYGLTRRAIARGAEYVPWRFNDGLRKLMEEVRLAYARSE